MSYSEIWNSTGILRDITIFIFVSRQWTGMSACVILMQFEFKGNDNRHRKSSKSPLFNEASRIFLPLVSHRGGSLRMIELGKMQLSAASRHSPPAVRHKALGKA